MNKSRIPIIVLLCGASAICAPAQDRPPQTHSPQKVSQRYSIEQATSDRAQLHTIAFSGLAFITGDFGACTFLPPGKVCDFFGFQYMRDIDAAEKGHNPVFLNRVAGNVLHMLNDAQLQRFEDLAAEQAVQLEELAFKRFPMIKAFHRELEGAIPAGSAGLDRTKVIRYAAEIFADDADMSYRRAEVFGQVAASLTAEQKAYLGKMKFGDFSTWPVLDERDKLKEVGRGKSQLFSVAYMTYASEFFSWYAGSVEADTYFCPERHGTYFGGFYMKDMPAMGKRDYDISTSRTGDSGETFLTLLTETQRTQITGIIEQQRKPIAEMIEVRRAISQELRKFLTGARADRAKVLALGRRYGELDGEVSWMYATAFAKVNRTLTDNQRAEFVKLRNLPGYQSAPAYVYSRPLPGQPKLPDTDSFFKVAGK
jgi:Spy/CpxP family protein refolding chaperone